MMIIYKQRILAAAIGSLLMGSGAANGALVSYNSTGIISGGGRSADGSGQSQFVAGKTYATAGNPSYTGSLPASWYTVLGTSDAATLSSADLTSAIHMGPSVPPTQKFVPELTTGAKAYQDVTTPSAPTNWGHTADFGLFQLTSATTVSITVAADGSALSPGFSVWQGWDNGSTGASRHASWLNNGAPALNPGQAGVLGSTLGAFEGTAYTATSGGAATLTLNLAAGDYTVILGGYSATNCIGTTCGLGGTKALYDVSFSTVQAVPLPGAAWLFGSALTGLAGFRLSASPHRYDKR